MGWKIRSKTAYIFERGTQRYIVGKFKLLNNHKMYETPLILVKGDRYSPVRIAHNYRNISRCTKQFLRGDAYAESLLILFLRAEFFFPIDNIESPIENYKPIYRILADHTDRHYALACNNHHPMQLFLYEFLNKQYRRNQAEAEAKNGGKVTFEYAVKKKVEYLKFKIGN